MWFDITLVPDGVHLVERMLAVGLIAEDEVGEAQEALLDGVEGTAIHGIRLVREKQKHALVFFNFLFLLKSGGLHFLEFGAFKLGLDLNVAKVGRGIALLGSRVLHLEVFDSDSLLLHQDMRQLKINESVQRLIFNTDSTVQI